MQVGMKGSIAHVLTNDKIEDKGACFKELFKETAKDTLTIGGITAGAAGAAAIVTGCSNKASNAFKNIITGVGNALDKIKIDSVSKYRGNKFESIKEVIENSTSASLKEIVKDSSIYKKIHSLPTPAKAAIAAGAAALALVGSIMSISLASKAGYIEGKHEVK